MYKRFITAIIVFSSISLSGCSSMSNQTQAKQLDKLVVAEPLSASYRDEIKLARINEILSQAEIEEKQRAVLLYERGVVYDSVGLRGLARIDFSRALQLRPDIANAYNYVGIHKTQLMQFSAAYEDFDSVLDLDPTHQFAYLNRAIALHYGGRNQLALDDIETFYQADKSDPYRIIWLYIIERDVDAELAMNRLKANISSLPENQWTTYLLKLFSKEISEDMFLATLGKGTSDNSALASQLCEAYFYLAKYSQYNGKQERAKTYFKLSMSTNVYQFVEHRVSELELSLLEQPPYNPENVIQ